MKNYFDTLEEKIFHYKDAYIDKPRKADAHLMLWCFKNLFKKLDKNTSVVKTDKKYTKSILFNLMGGIGDIIIALNFLVQMYDKFGHGFTFYITLPKVFKDKSNAFISEYKFLKLYDKKKDSDTFMAKLNLCRVPEILAVDFDAVKSESEQMFNWMQHIYDFNDKYPEYLKCGTTGDFLLTNFTKMDGRNRLNQADIDNMIGVKTVYKLPVEKEQVILKKYGLVANGYVTLQCGIGALSGNGLSTREWPVEKYNELIKLIKKQNKDLILVQIGAENDPSMNADLDLHGKTDFNEFLVILKNAKLHIGGESGCIHMRHFMGQKTSVVLFGPTFKDFYAYPENINISSGVCPGCEWLHNGWREICLKTGKLKPACLDKINADDVFNKTKDVLCGK